MREKNITKINVIMSLLQQVVVTVCGFILPRIILTSFGSDINGLVSSINQFLSYVSLLEGGITGVVCASLYKPLVDGSKERLSAVINAANSFYKKISLIFAAYTIVIAIIYPLFIRQDYSFEFIASLTLILGINLFVQYCFSITWKTLLIADRKVYIVSATYILVVIANTIVTIVLVKIYPSIHIVKLGSAIVYFLQPIIYRYYVKKHYSIDFSAQKDKKMLSQRWDGFGINIAAFIHNNTDVVVLTIFSTLSNISVYSVYFLVVMGLKNVVQAVSSGLSPTLGHIYASGNREQLEIQFSKTESILLFISFFLFTVGGFGITPFVQIYTHGVTDANYYQPLFGWLIIAAELIFCIREPYVVLAYCANRFKDFTKIAFIEAILNVVVSIILVYWYGIVGVAIGTIISMAFRTICQIAYLHRHILHRKLYSLIKRIVVNVIGMAVSCLLIKWLIGTCEFNITSWVLYCLKASFICAVVYGIGFLINRYSHPRMRTE